MRRVEVGAGQEQASPGRASERTSEHREERMEKQDSRPPAMWHPPLR